jgi:transposase InsO family protein
VRFAFIQKRCKEFPVKLMCQMLEVSRSGYYAWRDRPASVGQQRRVELSGRIRQVHEQSRGTYGSPRVTAELQDQGAKVCQNTVAKYMRQEGLRVTPRRRFLPQTTGSLLHHSDRGVQYACQRYRSLLQEHGIACSMSRRGNCYDNAVVESFFGTIKTERVHRERYRTRAEARSSVFEWIECWYNRRRRHSSLGHLSPETYEAQFN